MLARARGRGERLLEYLVALVTGSVLSSALIKIFCGVAATVEEFLLLLKECEEAEEPSREPRDATRRAVFITQMLEQRSSNYGYPAVKRYVVGAFVYGWDLVSYRRTTSSAVELPEIARKTAERQQEAYEEIKSEIERGLEGMGLDLPVYEGSLRYPVGPSEK